MQAVMNHSSALENFLFAGGRDYMMRSEKRSGSGPAHRPSASGGKPPRRRKKRAGFFYKMFMMILLLTIWPLGLLMLWQRKVRWGVATKLLTSVVTLAACIILIGFALTVNTGNPQYTKVQDSVNSFLDTAADTLLETGDIVAEYADTMFYDMENVADALWEKGKVHIANGIDAGVILAQQAKGEVLKLIESMKPDPEATPAADSETAGESAETEVVEAETVASPEAELTGKPTEAPSEAPAEEVSAEPEAKPEEEPAAEANTPEPAEVQTNAEPAVASAEATEVPASTAAAETDEAASEATEAAVEAIASTPEATEATADTSAATPEATEAPTPEPAPQVVVPGTTLKPAAQATVYHSSNGKWYHSFNRCSGMTGGGAYTLEECAATHKQCRACGAPDAALIGQPCLWKDNYGRCHTSDDCSIFEGKYTLVLRDEALEQGLAACDKCGAQEYLTPNTIIDYSALATVEPTLEPVA